MSRATGDPGENGGETWERPWYATRLFFITAIVSIMIGGMIASVLMTEALEAMAGWNPWLVEVIMMTALGVLMYIGWSGIRVLNLALWLSNLRRYPGWDGEW